MKTKFNTFNKIIGTEFRVGNILNWYISLAVWIVENEPENIKEENFRKWTKDSGIYEYKTQKNIKRFEMLESRLLNKFKLIKKAENNKYSLNCKIEEAKNYMLNGLTKTDGLTRDRDIETCAAFKAMLDFMIDYPNLNDSKRIFHSFLVYTTDDSFYELYKEENIIEKIVNSNVNEKGGLKIISLIAEGRGNFIRKPKNIKGICKKILSKKTDILIEEEEFKNAKKTFLKNFASNIEFAKFVKDNTYDEIAAVILRNSLEKNFNREFFDLFNRLLYSFGISPSTGINVKCYSNELVNKIDNKYIIKNNVAKIDYPYTISQVNNVLNNIGDKNYSFIKNDIHLNQIPRADISEYFVNIKFCYLKNIEPTKAKLFVNTILDEKLYPISHAPGGHSDMNWVDNNTIWGIETTLHDTLKKIIENELYSSIHHILKYKEERINNMLVMITQLPNKDYDTLKDMVLGFATSQFVKKNKRFEFKTYSFNELSKL